MPRDRERERELEELGARIEYPPTPDLARTVRQRLEAEDEETTARRGWLPALSPRWAAAAAMVVLVLAVPVFSPATRDALFGWFVAGEPARSGAQDAAEQAGGAAGGAAGESEYSVVPARPEDAEPRASSGGNLPSSAGSPGAPSQLGGGLGLGEPITPGEALARVGEVLVPNIGEPDELYAAGPEGVVLVYRARPGLAPLGETEIGLVLTQMPGDIEPAYVTNELEEESERVSVDGERGYWVPGGLSPSGRTVDLRAGVLVWEREGRALRLEADLPKEEAIRIAASVR